MIWVILLPSTVRGEFSRNAPAKLQVGTRCISLAELSKQFLAFSSTYSYHVFLVFQFIWGQRRSAYMANALCVDDVPISELLHLRPFRPARLGLEVQVLHRLMQRFSKDSSDFLDDVVQTSCELLDSGSAGVSLEETLPDGTKSLRWTATTGLIGNQSGQRMRRDHSPCGVVLARNRSLLFLRSKRFFRETELQQVAQNISGIQSWS